MKRSTFLILVMAATGGLAGCRPADPLDDSIPARTNMAYLLWRGDERARLTPDEWTWFDEALVDLRFELSDQYHVHQAAKLDELLLETLDGQTVRHATVQGLAHRLKRLRDERDQLSTVILNNANLLTYKGDADSEAVLDKLEQKDLEHRQKDVDDIASTRAILLKIGGVDHVSDPPGPFVLPKRGHAERPYGMPQ